jgi:DNA-binding response OmpR family regulator
MQLLLQMEGFEVHTAFTGADGLHKLSMFSPQVVCIDTEIHDFLVIDLVRQIKNYPHLSNALLIGMTSWDDADHPDASLKNAFDRSYVKPVPIEDLIQTLRNFCYR